MVDYIIRWHTIIVLFYKLAAVDKLWWSSCPIWIMLFLLCWDTWKCGDTVCCQKYLIKLDLLDFALLPLSDLSQYEIAIILNPSRVVIVATCSSFIYHLLLVFPANIVYSNPQFKFYSLWCPVNPTYTYLEHTLWIQTNNLQSKRSLFVIYQQIHINVGRKQRQHHIPWCIYFDHLIYWFSYDQSLLLLGPQLHIGIYTMGKSLLVFCKPCDLILVDHIPSPRISIHRP